MNKSFLLHWLQQYALEMGGQALVLGNQIQIQPTEPETWLSSRGSREPVLIAPLPENSDAWHTRLQYVEKAAAHTILSGPMGYACTLDRAGRSTRSRERTNIIRLAFGFSLSMGASCDNRYTAYYVESHQAVAFIEGSDQFLEQTPAFNALNVKEPKLKIGLNHLLKMLPDCEDHYRENGAVRTQVEKLNEYMTSELRDLERFYTPGAGHEVNILGIPDEKLRGEDRLDAEFSNKAQDIIEKYQARVVFHPLTVGLIECDFKIVQRSVTDVRFILPFVEQELLAQI